jgi:hypothetical protein
MGVRKFRGLTTLHQGKESHYPLIGRLHSTAKFFWVYEDKRNTLLVFESRSSNI